MLPLPTRFAGIILAFALLFVHRSWRHAQNLLVSAILTPGQRTVISVLRILGRAQERRFVNVYRILNRAAWCPRSGSRILLGLLVDAFVQRGPGVLGLDDTIERRRGKPRPTFADALAAVRCAIWRERTLATSPRRRARTKPRFRLPAPWAYALCHAA